MFLLCGRGGGSDDDTIGDMDAPQKSGSDKGLKKSGSDKGSNKSQKAARAGKGAGVTLSVDDKKFHEMYNSKENMTEALSSCVRPSHPDR